MKIEKIKITGFKNSRVEATIDFKNDISILYGLNGSGKTTVLKILHSVLNQKEDLLRKENVSKVVLTISGKNEVTQKIQLTYDQKQEKFDWSEIENSDLSKSKSLLIGVQRGVAVQYSTVSPSLVFDFLLHHNISREVFNIRGQDRSKLRFLADELASFLGRNRSRNRRNHDLLLPEGDHVTMDDVSIEVIEEALRIAYLTVKRSIATKIYNALFETFALAIDEVKITEIQIPENIVEIIKTNQSKLIEALEDAPDNEFKHVVIDRIQRISLDNSTFQGNKLFLKLLFKMVNELEQEKTELGTLNVLIEVFNLLLSEGKKMIIDRDGIRIQVNGSNHGLNDLSSGERHLLTFLTTILLDGINRDFIFIDEPEISLNILWQEKLLDLIHRMAPNTQIFVASHSQSIAEDHTLNLVEIKKNIING